MTVPTLPTHDAGETQAVLSAALRDVHGPDARLEGWTADFGFTEHGKRRVVRYELRARVASAPDVRHDQWVGKFYEREQDARRVADVLEVLADGACGARGGLRVPRVVAYHEPRRQLLLTYEHGEPVSSAIAHDTNTVLAAMGRALAALHATRLPLDAISTPAAVLADLHSRIEDLCAWLPGEATALRRAWTTLERQVPPLPVAPSFVHGDFGPANLLWSSGQIVVLDFDKCANGDPALDLGNLLAQLRRMTVRKPDRLRDFASARERVLGAYRGWAAPDPGLDERVGWYERATLLRKIHGFVCKPPRHREPDGLRHPHAEASRLLSLV
jgi:aminoglycoside phosphotransferase (APT) family kinase protein